MVFKKQIPLGVVTNVRSLNIIREISQIPRGHQPSYSLLSQPFYKSSAIPHASLNVVFPSGIPFYASYSVFSVDFRRN